MENLDLIIVGVTCATVGWFLGFWCQYRRRKMITKTTKVITTKDGNGNVISIQEQVETVESPDVKVISTTKIDENTTLQTQSSENRKRRHRAESEDGEE